MANLSQLSYTRWNNNIKVRHNNTRGGEHYRKDEQQCVLCTSSPLVSIPVLCAVKDIEAKKISNHF